MNKRTTLAVATAFALTVILTGCGNDEEDDDCEGSGQLTTITTVAMVEGTTSGSSGGSRSGGSKNPGKTSKHKPGKHKPVKVKIDDDLFEECDD